MPLLSWFRGNGRRLPWREEGASPYHVLVSEKLLQQTTVGHVMKVHRKFFSRYPTVEALAAAKRSEVEKLIKPLGFHRQRAGQLVEMANEILEKYGGEVPGDREGLLSLRGVGEYVADAVILVVHGGRVATVDVNFRNVIGRFFEKEGAKDKEVRKKAMRLMPKGREREFNWAVLDLGGTVCRTNHPKCEVCPLKGGCKYRKKLNECQEK